MIELNKRQKRAVEFVRKEGNITNTIYQKLNNISRETAKLDLEKMVKFGILERRGKGRGTYYQLSGKWVKMGNVVKSCCFGVQRLACASLKERFFIPLCSIQNDTLFLSP